MKIIIFDFDGTIADTLPFTWKKIIGYLRKEKLVHQPDEELIEEIRSKSYHDLINHFKISWLKLPLIILEVRKSQKELYKIIDKIKPFHKIKELLEKLRNSYRLGILSSNKKENITRFLKLNKLDFFEFVHCEINLFGKDKAIKNLIKKYHFNKDEIVYVADEVRDIEACKKAGVKIIAVTWGFNKKEILERNHPDYLVDEPEEILNVIS